MNRRSEEQHTLVGAYALDAISDGDRNRFERHLARCSACAMEVADLREVTARLAGYAAAQPPPGLTERVLVSAAQVRQLPPAAQPDPRQAAGQPGRPTLRSVRPGAIRAPRLAGALAAAFLVAAVGLGVISVHAEHQAAAADRNAHRIAEVLNAPDAAMLTARVPTGGSATVVMSGHDHALVFTTDGLRRLPTGCWYQLWLMGPSGDRPAGRLPAPRDGMTSPVIASGITAGERVGLTIERNGTPSQPTGTPVVVMALS